MKIRTLDEIIETNTIVKHVAGSHAYGTNIETSDIDIRGIFIADPVNILTPFFTVEEKTDDKQDFKLYEFNKFMQLYTLGNPNILETLWVDKSDILQSCSEYWELRSYRQDLLSSKIAFTTTGYAAAQIKRIKGHNKWINNPQPVDPPRQTDYITLLHWFGDNKFFRRNFKLFNFRKDYRLIPYSKHIYAIVQQNGYETYDIHHKLNVVYEEDIHELNHDILALIKFNYEVYDQDNTKWKDYWNWKKNRNEVRSSLEEEFGFDTKHAMHCVRLMRMGAETLETGEVYIKRPDAKELLDIRNGKWSYEQIIEYSEYMDNKIRNELYNKTSLPKYVDLKLAAEIAMTIQEKLWGIQYR